MGAYFKVRAFSRGCLFNLFPVRVGAYSKEAVIRGFAIFPRKYERRIDHE